VTPMPIHACGAHPQDKLRQKQFFAAAGVPVADFRGIESAGDLAAAAAEFGFPFMLKSRM
jgi:phosphoribosylaminoimidazole carboxylase (NCAIR synthetase)